jgi:hypothetical protein
MRNRAFSPSFGSQTRLEKKDVPSTPPYYSTSPTPTTPPPSPLPPLKEFNQVDLWIGDSPTTTKTVQGTANIPGVGTATLYLSTLTQTDGTRLVRLSVMATNSPGTSAITHMEGGITLLETAPNGGQASANLTVSQSGGIYMSGYFKVNVGDKISTSALLTVQTADGLNHQVKLNTSVTVQ